MISALVAPSGTPAVVVSRWVDGGLDLVVSPLWLGELERVTARPQLQSQISPDEVHELYAAFMRQGVLGDDPPPPPGLTPDPGDDYLVSLARVAGARWIVSGDRHLLDLVDPDPPVVTPRVFLETLPPAPACGETPLVRCPVSGNELKDP